MESTLDIETFLRDKALEELSPATLRTYRSILEMFSADMQAQGLRLQDVDVEIVKKWLWKKKEEGASSNWLHHLTVVLKNFYGWTAKDLKTPKAQNVKPINVLNNEEVRRLYGAARSKRDKAIIAFGYQAGARRTEVFRTNIGDVDFNGGHVRIRGKGGKVRNVPLNSETLEILRSYLATRGDVQPSDPLFLSREGNRLTVYGLHWLFRRLRKRVNIPDAKTRVHFHMLRHCFAKHLYQGTPTTPDKPGSPGVKIRALQQLLGHSSIAITEKYLILLGCEVAEEYLAAAPALSLNQDTL